MTASTESSSYFRPGNLFVEFSREKIEQSLPAVFEQIVEENAERQAVVTDNESLSYSDLNRLANRIANTILEKRGPRQEPVAIMVANNTASIAGILGLLKANKICVPVDATVPAARAKFIIADSQAAIMIDASDDCGTAQWDDLDVQEVLNVDNVRAVTADHNPSIVVNSTDLAHIIYTSGSTSEPKGVIDLHRNVLHQVMVVTNSSYYSNEDRMTLLRAPSSTGGLANLYSALLNGACLFPFQVQQQGINQLASWIIDREITVYHSSAAVFRNWVQSLTKNDHFPYLRLIRLGSEQVTKHELEKFRQHFATGCILINALSCTEAITFCQNVVSKSSIILGEVVPVGYAVTDMEILLLDDAGELVNSGDSGEIAIRSEFLSPGYWRKPELTRRVFLPEAKSPAVRVYLTGDVGRMGSDGCLEYIGRKDFQVKIRGYRVNTDEIETMLLGFSWIKEAAVMVRKSTAGDNRLVAYVVFNSGAHATIVQIRHLLSERIPEYMIPSSFVILPALPLTANGKIDRRALPESLPLRSDLDNFFTAAETEVEKKLTQIWSEVLELDLVGVDDDFFDLGGDSLLAGRIVTRINRDFGTEMTVADFFGLATVAKLSRAIKGTA